jgi:hypothetical protein
MIITTGDISLILIGILVVFLNYKLDQIFIELDKLKNKGLK